MGTVKITFPKSLNISFGSKENVITLNGRYIAENRDALYGRIIILDGKVCAEFDDAKVKWCLQNDPSFRKAVDVGHIVIGSGINTEVNQGAHPVAPKKKKNEPTTDSNNVLVTELN